MADKSVQIEVRGIRELGTAFRAVSTDLPKELKGRFLAIAENVVGKARGLMPHESGDAAASVRARGRAGGASIAFGGTKAPHMPWLDFGGSVGRGHRPGVAWSGATRREWKGSPTGSGRYVYPAISEARPETEAAVEDALREAAEKAGFETRGL
jgi:hypothetical protein